MLTEHDSHARIPIRGWFAPTSSLNSGNKFHRTRHSTAELFNARLHGNNSAVECRVLWNQLPEFANNYPPHGLPPPPVENVVRNVGVWGSATVRLRVSLTPQSFAQAAADGRQLRPGLNDSITTAN